MPKIIPQTELDSIVEIVSGFSEPVSLEQIFSHLQDRLAGIGKRGGRRYHVPSVKERPTEKKVQEAADREIIPLSQEAKEIRTIIYPASFNSPAGRLSNGLPGFIPAE